jgi:hypothetical protein
MLDLASLTEDFIRNDFQKLDWDNGQDEPTVRAVGASDMEPAARKGQLRKWLDLYKVIRFFPQETRGKIVRQILKYADDGSRPRGPLGSKAAVLSEYEKLRQRIQAVIAPGRKSGKPPEVTSLTSKALWCCYPNDVPIFDANAEKALQVASRLCRIAPEPAQTPYALFVDVWLQLYEKLKPVIEQADLKGYPYRVRVLDILLWHVGSPGFESPATDVAQTRPIRKLARQR